MLVLLPARSVVADTSHEFWPELDLWYSVAKPTRLLLTAAGTRSRDDGDRVSSDLALYVDHRQNEHISWRAGYLQAFEPEDETGKRHSTERRVVLDFNYRWRWGERTRITDRTRLDLRDINDADSTRVRNRLRIESEMKSHEIAFTPYANVEAYYDDRFGTVNRWRLEAGATMPSGRHLEWDAYLGWQHDSEPQSQTTQGFGVTLNVNW